MKENNDESKAWIRKPLAVPVDDPSEDDELEMNQIRAPKITSRKQHLPSDLDSWTNTNLISTSTSQQLPAAAITATKISFCHRYILVRMLLSLLTLFFIFLCGLYGIGQITELGITDFLCENKSIAEIRAHSRQYLLPHGTDGECWTAKGIKANPDLLFKHRTYQTQLIDLKQPAARVQIVKFALFILCALFLMFCLVYAQIFLFIKDTVVFVQMRKNPMQFATNNSSTASTDIDDMEDVDDDANRKCAGLCNCIDKCVTALKKCKAVEAMYERYFLADKPCWIFKYFCTESLELVLQTIACLQYAGVQLQYVGNVVNLAEPHAYVLLFGAMIGVNAIVTGMMWLMYCCNNAHFHGRSFHYTMFVVDAVFDIFYAVFPMILIWDQIDAEAFLIQHVGTFYTNSWLAFLRSLVPIVLICLTIFLSSRKASVKTREMWENELSFKRAISDQQRIDLAPIKEDEYGGDTDTAGAVPLTLSRILSENAAAASDTNPLMLNTRDKNVHSRMQTLFGDTHTHIDRFINDRHCCKLWVNTEALLDHSYSHRQVQLAKQQLAASDAEIECLLSKYDRQQCLRRCCVGVAFGLLHVVFGVLSIVLYQTHFAHAVSFCEQYRDSSHLEMQLWQYCTLKVYPLVGLDAMNDIPCQCRWFDINSASDLHSDVNITDSVITHMFSHWFMLENVRISPPSDAAEVVVVNFTDAMFASHSMRAIALSKIRVLSISPKIENWKHQLEYFSLSRAFISDVSNDAMATLSKLKYVDLQVNLLHDIDWICELHQLVYIDIYSSPNLINKTLPSCIWEQALSNLQVIDIGLVSGAFHEALLGLPALQSFRAFDAKIKYTDFSQNAFVYHREGTEYDFSNNDVCARYRAEILQKNQLPEMSVHNYQIVNFLNETGACTDSCNYGVEYGLKGYHQSLAGWVCPALKQANGVCEDGCNVAQCGWDGGDCHQLCDFNECQIEWGECNRLCNTSECDYGFGQQCLPNVDVFGEGDNFTVCAQYTQCSAVRDADHNSWLADNICDQNCNNDWCDFDGGDCNKCVSGSLCQLFWDLFVLFANGQEVDYLISNNEFCQLWSLIGSYDTENRFNCSTAFVPFDLNHDGQLNAFEAQTAAFNKNYGLRAYQVNCSLCAIDVETYYKPWTWQQVVEYTSNATKYSVDLYIYLTAYNETG